MFRTLRAILNEFPQWERPAQVGLITGAVLLVAMLAVGLIVPAQRQNALLATGGLLLTLQLIVLWANRGMVTDHTRAQRLYLQEDFEAARDLLERIPARERSANAIALLGNTYRQLGMLPQSRAALHEALALAPDHHYPLYGFGRTLLVSGEFGDAARTIAQALEQGAPAIVKFDLAEAAYRAGDLAIARHALTTLPASAEAHRNLMAHYLLYRLGEAEQPSSALVHAGLAYWQATAARFRDTPYGIVLAEDIHHMQAPAKEN